MPTLNLGRVGFVSKGTWSNGLHKINDLVSYGTAKYACILEHTSTLGDINPTNTSYWQKWTDYGSHSVDDISNAVVTSADSQYINYFSGTQTGVISVKITNLVTATASTVDLGSMEITITQDDRDHSSATNPNSYKILIKANMDVGVWYNTQAIMLGTNSGTAINVRFTRTTTDAYIEIGDISSTWVNTTVGISGVTSYILTGYNPVFLATIQASLLGTIATDSIISTTPYLTISTIHAATSKATPIDADEFGIWDSVSGLLNKLTFANLKAMLFSSPTVTGTLTAPTIATNSIITNKATVNVTSWSYATTTITLNVASHTFMANNYINVNGLASTTNAPNGVWIVTSVTSSTIVFNVANAPTGTATVSGATCAGWVTTNGTVDAIGVGQTWQNVTASRVSGTTYTNTTGKPIMVVVSSSGGGSSASDVRVYIDSVLIARDYDVAPSSSFGTSSSVSVIVPNLSTYEATWNTTPMFFELR